MAITEFQERVYTTLLLIPPGQVSSYLGLSRLLSTSPRAVGNALRNNPYAPDVPCHRVIAASGYIGGFMGEWQKAPSGVNQTRKRVLLDKEGVKFNSDGMLLGDADAVWWSRHNTQPETLTDEEVEMGRKLLREIVDRKDGDSSRYFAGQRQQKTKS